MRVPSHVVARFLGILGILAGICLLLAPAVHAGPALVGATLAQSPGEVILTLSGDGPIHYDVFQLNEPDRVVLDLLDASAAVEPTVTGEDGTGWFQAVRQGLWRDEPDGQVVRYVLETSAPSHYGVTVDGDQIRLCVTREDGTSDGEVTDASEGTETVASTLTTSEETRCAEGTLPTGNHAASHGSPDMAPSLGAADPAVPAVALSAPPDEPTMSLDVQGAEIRTVLRSIAEFGKVNIVADRDIEGSVSVRLKDVPWRQALEVVCESAALSAVERQDVIRVATRKAVLEEEIEQEAAARKREELLPLETEILPVNYANAEELKRSVTFALSKRGSAEVDTRTNSILVTDYSERIGQIRGMVKELDTETPQVEIVAKMVAVEATTARELGITWTVDNLHSSSERMSGSISHKSPLATATTEMKIGVIRSFANIDATIQALENENKANLLSNPRITTVNNRKARILVGQEVPLIILDEAGNPITELKKVGVTLEVTPYINAQGRVTMDLHPEVSDLSSQATVQGGIVFNTREADTRVMVNDGETAVIGGLIAQQETRFTQGVPVLKSLPVLGHFFRMSDVRRENRELMIFVTPRIIHGSAGVK
jgi:type IV pilus secretin PilQ/predicted competence protein